jgi:hypothetical protein
MPFDKRRLAPQPHTIVPPAPPASLLAFTGRKCKYIHIKLNHINNTSLRSLSKTCCSRNT